MIEEIAVWSLYPDWADGMTETLEFLTSVVASPFEVEQRRGLRLTPRQSFEYSYVLFGPARTYFDLLTLQSAGSPVYVPLWHDLEVTIYPAYQGQDYLYLNYYYTEMLTCDIVLVIGNSPFIYEVHEIFARYDGYLEFKETLAQDWPIGTRVVPMKRCKVDQQPSTTWRADRAMVARMRFQSLEPNRTAALNPLNSFGKQYVLEDDPNVADDLSYTYERVMSTLDNTMGLQRLNDITGKVVQQFAWWERGRVNHYALRGMFYALDGRRVPLWVPTQYADFELVLPVVADVATLNVKYCGYTDLGGPFNNREYILIHLRGGRRIYRKITGSVVFDDTTESLFIDTAIGEDLAITDVIRISFLALYRLDQDTVEFNHHTNTKGLTTVVATFRSGTGYVDDLEDIEVPPVEETVPGEADVCLDDLQWWTDTLSITTFLWGRTMADRLDAFGNFYISRASVGSGQRMEIYSPDGVLLNTITDAQFKAAIDAWYGDPIIGTGTSYSQALTCFPIKQGEYLLWYAQAGHSFTQFEYWWAISAPNTSGTLDILGAVYYLGLNGPPLAGLRLFDVHDNHQPIVYGSWYGFSGFPSTGTLGVLPPIEDIIGGLYADCRIEMTILHPMGNRMNLAARFGLNLPQRYVQSANWGFTLPGSGGTVLYIYINRDWLDTEASLTGSACVEIRDVIRPASPFGAMIKIPLRDVNYEDLAAITISGVYRGAPSDDYEMANSDWTRDGLPAIPFDDEYTFLSGAEGVSTDTYSSQVSTIRRSNGHYWVVFYMVGVSDAIYYSSNPITRVRVFDYDPNIEKGVQVFVKTCSLFQWSEVVNDPSQSVMKNAQFQIASITETDGVATLALTAPVWKTLFLNFTIPT